MNKLELIYALKDATNLTKPQTSAIVEIFFNGMANALAKGERVDSGDCAPFSLRKKDPTLAGIPRPAKRLESNLRNFHFSRPARN